MAEPLERTVVVRCSVQHAFDVFCDRIDAWWPRSHRKDPESKLTLTPQVGGLFQERAPDGQVHQLGEVLACEPPHRIRYSWVPGSITGPTEVEIRFRPDGERTVVEVTHREGQGADAFPLRVALFARSWDTIIKAFDEATQAPANAPSKTPAP